MSHGPDAQADREPVDPDVEPCDLPASGTGIRELVRTRADVLLAIAAGGAIGSLGRWGLAQAWPGQRGGFPWPTFTVNVLGSLLLGVLIVVVVDVSPEQRYVRPFLGVGVLGGFTTFSTYALDTRALIADGSGGTAALYLGATIVAGLLAVFVGLALTRRLVRR